MIDTTWQSYLREISTNQSEIARATGVHSGTVSRWLAGSSRPSATQVIAVARAYDRSPVLALVAADYLTREEVEGEVRLTPGMSLAAFTELEIAEELVRRIEAGQTTAVSDSPLTVDHPAWANVGGAADDDAKAQLRENLSLRLTLVPADGGIRVRDDNDVEYPDVMTAWQEFHQELERNGLALEDLQLRSAAKSNATEVEEDLHTP
ncbi:helix-turn-helix domain-containing protein [Curtobacterium flaccumfaciens]|uniref:helix-turn-helix domain-containing protein n=1 Tax=Curtobacterium flaccumfaciens TaxID=2035 RepID=UPI00188A5CA4|nr:helix-turn-helix domain-containing protein [Curtobacterium flaccumfaciens]MBF4628932.1 helix-turn-helix transcriptional regulator [Curtobacterium flaccumfaciens]